MFTQYGGIAEIWWRKYLLDSFNNNDIINKEQMIIITRIKSLSFANKGKDNRETNKIKITFFIINYI